MGQQIKFFEKNYIDYDFDFATVTATVGSPEFLRNRNNYSAWLGSVTSSAPQSITTFFGTRRTINEIFIVDTNVDSYVVEYYKNNVWNVLENVYVDTPDGQNQRTINISFNDISCDGIKLSLTSTLPWSIAYSVKQLIITSRFQGGQLESWPEVSPSWDQQKIINEVMSGKASVTQSVGAWEMRLRLAGTTSVTDVAIIQEMYQRLADGFLVYPSGGDEDQFMAPVNFWTEKDFFLMKPVDNFRPEWFAGLYKSGVPIDIKLREVIR